MSRSQLLASGAELARLKLRGLRDAYPVLWPKLTRLCQHEPRDLVMPRARPLRMQNPPRISIVTPSFRHAHFIERTLDSVLNQGYPNLEYVVQDGGSEDGTKDILEKYSGRLTRWVSERDSGQGDAINRGFAGTDGTIMAFLNSDDLLLPGALATVAEFFSKHPTVDVVYGHRVIIDENDKEVGRWVLPPHDAEILRWADWIPQETMFWRRSAWERVGGHIDTSFQFALDWDLLLRFQDAGLRLHRIPRFMGAFRIHPSQKTSAQISDIGNKEMDRLRRRNFGRDVTWQEINAAVSPYILRHLVEDLKWRATEPLRKAWGQ